MKAHILAITALSCTACTSLKVHQFDEGRPESRIGIPYPLGFTQYRIEIARQVVGCGREIDIAVGAKIEEARNAPDPLRRYLIDPNSLASIMKTSEVKLEYGPNGLVKSLNATAEDKTAEVIANVGGIAVKLASLAAAPGAAGAGPEACSDMVLKALEQIKLKTPALQVANNDLERSLASLKAAKAKVEQMGGAIDEDTKRALSKAQDGVAAATSAQKAATEALAAETAKVTHTETVYWPENGDVGRGVIAMDPAVLQGWTRNLNSDPAETGGLNKLDVFVELVPITGGSRSLSLTHPASAASSAGPSSGGATPTVEQIDPRLGIPYRQPHYAELRICNVRYCSQGGERLIQHRSDVLQLGEVYYLSCKSRPFASVACGFEFTDAGWLKSMGTSQKQAAMVGATGAMKGLLDDALNVRTTLAGAERAALEAKTKELKAQAEYEAAVKALAPTVDPNAAVTAETAAVTAQMQLARAKTLLLTAESELASAQAQRPAS